MPVSFLNIHSHWHSSSTLEVTVVNRHEHFSDEDSSWISCGIHPWYINEQSIDRAWSELQIAAKSNRVVAIGECGLDKVCATDWNVQLKWFEKQIGFANEIERPLIIHCVRAFNEVIHLLEKTNNKVPVVFHGFKKKLEIADMLVKKGYYLSFGKSILQEERGEVLKWIPADRFFLENDDSDVSIERIYERAANIKGLSLDGLKNQIWSNAQIVFGKKIEEWKI